MRIILYFDFLIFNIKIIQNKNINILPLINIKLNTIFFKYFFIYNINS